MAARLAQLSTFCLSALALLCWVVMFVAGTDVWHFAGRPDFWHLQGPPYQDLRAFAYAFYLLWILLTVHLIAVAADLVTSRRRAKMNGA